MPDSLMNRRVLVTRPAHQSANLVDLLKKAGAEPVLLPLLEIQPIDESAPSFHLLKQSILDLDLYQHIIFISPNAAKIGYDWIDQYWPQLPVGIKWYAIGKKTAQTLDNYGIDAYHSPLGYDSEALLNCSALQEISGEKILIMRGQGGREKLADELRARGAEVSYAELYVRQCPEYTNKDLLQALTPTPDAILISSGEGLENLQDLIEPTSLNLDSIKTSHVIVPSDRIHATAKAQGFKRISTASGPDDLAMIECLKS